MIVLILMAWFLSGFLAYAGSFAYFQGKYPEQAVDGYREDLSVSMSFIPFGLIAFFTVMYLSGFFKYGFKFK